MALDFFSGDGTRGADATVSGLTFKDGLYTSGTISGFLTEETYIRSVWLQTSTTGATAPFSGYLNDTTSYTAFTLVVAGTMTGGTIRVYGYANS
jgi:hypothetical protein